MSVGTNICRIRDAQGVSQSQLADRVGVSQAMICAVEKGVKNPSLQLAWEIAKCLGCKIEAFLEDVPSV